MLLPKAALLDWCAPGLRKFDENRLTASEMKFMRRTAGYTKWDHQRNEYILQELGLEPILQYIHQDQDKWLHHVKRMPRSRILRAVLNYRRSETRSPGRPVKR